MANPMTAQQMVQLVRDELQHMDQSPYWDGFGTPPAQPGAPPGTAPPTSILFQINVARRELPITGDATAEFTQALTVGQAKYTLNVDNAEIHHVTIANQPITRQSLLWLDANFPGWENLPPGDPLSPSNVATLGRPLYYTTVGNVIIFQPAPDQPYNAAILGEGTPTDLAQPADTPWELPTQFHSLPCYMAALALTNMDIENDAAQRRVALLNTKVQEMTAHLKGVMWERSFDSQDNVNVMDYRQNFRRGADA